MIERLILENCSVVDVISGSLLDEAVVIIEGDRIVDVGPSEDMQSAANAAHLDLAGGFVLPGLINCHVHFGLVLPGQEGDALRGESDAALALRMARNAYAALAEGITTVRLVGERPYVDIALRGSIERGETLGPRVLTAGPLLISTGGHGWELESCIEVDGADAFRAAVRKQLRYGTDLVKISVSGGLTGENEKIADSHMTRDEILAVTDAAHSRGRKVAAHAGPTDAIETAVECGVDTIEHGYFLAPEVAALMSDARAWLVPTINVSRAPHYYDKIGAPDWYQEKALAAGQFHWASLETAIAVGVPIAMGTDMMPHEPFDGTSVTVREIEFYVEAGMTPLDALRTATVNAADLLGRTDIGRVEIGAVADLIVLRDDPLKNISALREIRKVVARGRLLAPKVPGLQPHL